MTAGVIDRAGFDELLGALATRGYRIIAPIVRDGAIVYDEVGCGGDLPAGWTEAQEAGSYRLVRRDDGALFGYTVGPQSWKRFALPADARLWKARRDAGGALVDIEAEPADRDRYAFVGVRSCDLHAGEILRRVLSGSKGRGDEDPFVVAVNCGQAGGTCFCVSMGTGPRVEDGFDLALTEVLDGERHAFVVEIGSERGAEVLADVPVRPATDADTDAPERAAERAAAQMGRHMQADGLRDLLLANLEHPRWDDVAERCLTCGNCTLVCPTCFCTSVEDVTDVTGEHVERWQRWDSCFTIDHSHIHGGDVRRTPRSRYRQWMTHKLATWFDQFGSSGCVGCGRCITWCPVGIDITQEIAAIKGSEAPHADA